jgi:hypothetical protein
MRKKVGFLTCAGLAAVFAALALPAQADVRSESMLRQFLEGIDQAEEWSATSDMILSEGADTIAENIVISRDRRPITEIRIERLRLRDLGERDGGGFRASEIEMTGATLVGSDMNVNNTFDYSVPTATITQISMPSFAGFEFDTGRMMSSLALLYSLTAEGELQELLVPSMVGTAKSLDADGSSESRVEYQNFRAAGLSGGVFQEQQAGPIIASGTSPEGLFHFRIERVGVDTLDLGAFAHIFDPARYADGVGDGIWRPLASSIRYSGVTGNGPEGVTVNLAEFAIEGIDGRQPELPFTAEWDRLLDPGMPDEAKADLAFEAVGNLAIAWRAGTIRLSGLSVNSPPEGVQLSLGSMSFSGLSSEGFDSFLMSGVSGEGPTFSLGLDSVEIAGFAFPDIEAMMLFAALETDVDPQLHEDIVRRAFAGLPRLNHFGLSGLSAGESADQLVTLASITLDMGEWNDLYAGATDLRIDDLVIPGAMLRQDPETAPFIEAMGFDSLTLDISASDRWSPDAGTDDFSFSLAAEDVFEFGFSYLLGGLTDEWMIDMIAEAGKTQSSEEATLAMLSALTFEHGEVRATDRSLLDRGFSLAAELQGLSVDGPAYRQQMRGALPFLLSTVIPAALAQQITPPLQEFMDGGKTLVAEFAPVAPVPIVEIVAAGEADPTTLPDLLGMSVRSEPASQ